MQARDIQRLKKLESENRRIRELLGAGPRESAEAAVEKLWRSYRDLLDKVSHLSDDCQREARRFGLVRNNEDDIEDDDYETTPAEAQAEWERQQKGEKSAKRKRRKSKANENTIPEGVESERRKQRRHAREAAGFTPEQVAQHFGISMAYYESIEGEGCAEFDMALRLSRLFDCSLDIYIGR